MVADASGGIAVLLIVSLGLLLALFGPWTRR